MTKLVLWRLPMNFPSRLIQLRKEQGFTQQQMADCASIHVNQIKRYESGSAQPTLEALVKLSKALSVSLDELVFDDQEPNPDKTLQLQFEAIQELQEDDKKIIKEVLEGLIFRYKAKRWIIPSSEHK